MSTEPTRVPLDPSTHFPAGEEGKTGQEGWGRSIRCPATTRRATSLDHTRRGSLARVYTRTLYTQNFFFNFLFYTHVEEEPKKKVKKVHKLQTIYSDHEITSVFRSAEEKEVINLMTLFSCQFLVRALFFFSFVSFTVIVAGKRKKKELKRIWWRMCGAITQSQLPTNFDRLCSTDRD